MNNGSSEKSKGTFFGPWQMFRQLQDAYLESTAKAMVDLVNSEPYAELSGTMLGTYLELAEPVRAWMDKVTPHVLAHYGLPSRKELISVASRMNSIELRLDDMEAMLQEIREALRGCEEKERKAA